ncbi:radical SAM protein [Limnohabitans sp. T6-5]|uniref:radical SAM protein n=1 Tax=Limnohabitans sp. T6-5 TaxID=1100724 RepID=UPI000D34FB6A|nr:radical SAM protein [Limnohabitans sp. T6-5]PUE11091.1 radical SAM protein [Limnohabitans sp. T6-5]
MSRKLRPYLYYDTTTSVCTTCLHPAEAKIIFKDDKVYMDKWCPTHGMERVLMSDDVDYYRLGREVFVKPPEMPNTFNSKMTYGCPYDCGLCPDHMQHSCLSIVEINDHCNLNCPICYADSGTHRPEHRSLQEVCQMLDTVVANEGAPDVVQISGGEPTTHPQFFEILDEARKRPVKHLMINTNGVRIAQDEAFVQRLASYGPKGLEIYLQFDSLRAEALKELRGADLTRIRQQALERLNAAGLSTTLVVTVKRGLNDKELGDIIRHGLAQPCVRGITFQPIQEAGRTDGFGAQHRLTVSEIRREIATQSDIFTLDDIVPVPCNPDTLAMGYAIKAAGQTVPLTRHLSPQALVQGAANTIVFEQDASAKELVFKLFSTNHSPESQASCLSELMCCLPQVSAPQNMNYDNVFRILIVQFMDATNLDMRALKKSCIHFATPEGQMVPFEAYNLFYRPGKKARLDTIRRQLEQQHRMRTEASVIPIQPV